MSSSDSGHESLGFGDTPQFKDSSEEQRERSNSQPWLSRMQRHMALTEEQKRASKSEFFLLLSIQTYVCFFSNGALPSIQTYSCLPFGNTVYHLAVTLNAIANPLMAFLAFFVPCTSQGVVLCLAVLGWALSTFILATALASPGMIAGLTVGGSLVVITWVVTGALFSYVKVSVAGMCRDSGLLFQCGALTQAGSAGGALLMFLLVNQVGLFQGYYVSCGG